MPKTAIILGATGATGSSLLLELLDDNRYGAIKLFSRSASGISHPKVQEHLVNLFELEKHAATFTGHEVFCCIGTTKAKTPDKEVYHKIDYGIPVAAARLARKNAINTFIVVSAVGSNPKSGVFYIRTKGEMERDVVAQQVPKTHILQPSLIVAQRNESRVAEKIFIGIWAVLNPLFFGRLAKYRSTKAQTIAKAMVKLANTHYNAIFIPTDKIQEIANGTNAKWMP